MGRPVALGVGIIGCGAIGHKRAKSLGGTGRLVACADLDLARARAVGGAGVAVHSDWPSLLARSDVDAVVIATRHDVLAEITKAAIESGKHVLVEKPAARTAEELLPAINAVKGTVIKVHVGFNHRYHRALRKAKEIVLTGALGPLMMIRARYGHGGRLGYDREWRADPALAGGGELIDQGPHLIDLSRWFLGEFSDIQGFAHTSYWDMPVDDNAFLLLRTPTGQTASLHVSCTEWKNMFSMEIYGRDGKLEITGLGGSYGVERLTWYRMLPEMGPPETTAWEYPMPDNSWSVETNEFLEDIVQGRDCSAGLNDAYEALKIVNHVYRASGYKWAQGEISRNLKQSPVKP